MHALQALPAKWIRLADCPLSLDWIVWVEKAVNIQNKNGSPTGFTGREKPKGEVLPAAKLQPKYTLPSGERLKKMSLIGRAYAEAWANPHKRESSPNSKGKSSQPVELSPQEKLGRAQQEVEKWNRVASSPGLSPPAMMAARNLARSAMAEATLRHKALQVPSTLSSPSTTQIPGSTKFLDYDEITPKADLGAMNLLPK